MDNNSWINYQGIKNLRFHFQELLIPVNMQVYLNIIYIKK